MQLDFQVGWVGRLVLVNDVDEAGAVGEGEDVGGQGDSRKEGEEEFHGWVGVDYLDIASAERIMPAR